MIKRIALLLLFCAPTLLAQVGGPTAQAPLPNTTSGNLISSANSNFSSGTFAGYGSVNACATVSTANPYPGDTFSVRTNCSAASTNLFSYTLNLGALSPHEAIWVSWQEFAPAGYVGNGLNTGFSDNTHGGGSVLWSRGRQSPVISGPTGGWVQGFAEVYINKLEHAADSNIGVQWDVSQPVWAANHVYTLGTQIIDSNKDIETVTTAGTSGTPSAPSWPASGSSGVTTPDGTGTLIWTSGGSNPPYYISHIVVEPAWFPLRNFVGQPVYRGLVWADLAPVTTWLHGVPTCSNPVIGAICGDAEIDPPPGFTLSTVTLNEKMETSSTCSGSPLFTDSIASPLAVQPWEITPTQYGGMPTVGTFYYVCATLNATSGGTLLASYPPFALQFDGATYRATLNSYYLPTSQWILNGNKSFLLGTYNRLSSSECSLCLYTTKSAYELNIMGYGFGLLPASSGSAGGLPYAKTQGNTFADQSASGYTSVLSSFGSDSGVNPTPGASDQLTPGLAAYADYGISKWQIWNNWESSCISQTATITNPSSPSGTAATGSITANFLFIQWVAACSPIPQFNSPQRTMGLTLPSTATSVNLTTAGCAGVNCGITITTPACANTRNFGGLIYVGTNSVNTVPANSAMFLQYPSSAVSPQLTPADYLPCGATFTLTSLFTAGVNPPTVDNTGTGAVGAFRPTWATSGQSDQTLWGLLMGTSSDGMCFSPTPGAAAGFYTADEIGMNAYPFQEQLYQFERANCIQEPISGVIIDNTTNALFRDMVDVPGSDNYAVLRAASPEDYAAGTSATNSATFYTTNNQTATSNQYFLNRTDQATNEWATATYGDRPAWNVFQQYISNSSFGAFPYQVIDQQLWKIIIGCRVGGGLGCGALSWGNVSSTGSTPSGWPKGNTQTWSDNKQAFNEVKALIPQLESPVVDSSMMNAGTGLVSGANGAQVTAVGGQQIVSNIATSVTSAIACNIQAGTNSQYTNTTNFPFGPVEWASSYFTPTNTNLTDIYIFSTNYCNSTFSVTFGLAAVPAATKVQVLYEGRTLNINTSGCPNSTAACFTDTWSSFERHVYAIEQPRGAVIH